jgi:hypothetical protein
MLNHRVEAFIFDLFTSMKKVEKFQRHPISESVQAQGCRVVCLGSLFLAA